MPELTPEFAETVPLSLHPLRRSGQVIQILANPAMTGEGVTITFNYNILVQLNGEWDNRINVWTTGILAGRRVLKKAAVALQFLNNEGEN